MGWRGAKARGEAPGLEDPDIPSLFSEKETENPAHIVKSALNSKATVGRVLRSPSTKTDHTLDTYSHQASP